MDKLSIVILNYNAGDFLVKCLKSIRAVSDEADITTYLVDNLSTDGSFEKAKKKKLADVFIQNENNLGFGAGNNVALEKVKTEYILILNPDTVLQKGVVWHILNFMKENPECGAASCKVVFQNGEIDPATHRGFPTPIASLLYMFGNSSMYHLTGRDMKKVHEVDSISGAFFFTRKEVLDKVGLFDKDYFMYAEDIDLCFRIKDAGYKIFYVPDVQITHFKGVSSGLKRHSQDITTATPETRLRSLNAFYETMKIFYDKHYNRKYPFVLKWLVFFGIDIRKFLANRKLTV